MRDETGDRPAESRAQRDDRNLVELIQELRVVGLGVQVLFGFLLSLPFTTRFASLTAGRRGLYLASLTLAAVATALLIGPVAYHRLVFRRGLKESLVRFSNWMAILGLAAVGAAVLTSVLLVTSYVAGWLPAALISALVGGMFFVLWFALPLSRRREAPYSTARQDK
jgi:MFS family permease